MTSPLSGMMAMPEQKPSKLQTIGAVLGGFGAGFNGQGQQYLANLEQQKQQLSTERQKAWVQDGMTLYQTLGKGDTQSAIALLDDRISKIVQLGGDPSDSLEAKELITKGDIPAVMTDLEQFLGEAQNRGLLPAPQTIKPSETFDGELVQQDPLRGITRTRVADPTSNAPGMGLTPLVMQDAQGNYIPAQLSDQGGMVPVDIPEGMRFVPDAARMGYDPRAIQTRGSAETGVQVDRTQQLAAPQAQAAGMTTAAQQQAEIDAIAARSEAELAATRTAQAPQAIAAQEGKENQQVMLDDLIDRATESASGWTTGMIGSAAAKIPGTNAHDLSKTLDTIRANIGFDKLQSMRDNSPTGGALGQVSNFELDMLQAVFGSLEQSQSKEQFQRNLELVRQQVHNIVHGSRDKLEAIYGQTAPETGDIFSQADAILNGL